jgi:hypothetical protein
MVPPKLIHYFNGILNYLNLGRWFRDRKLVVPVRCYGREQLYDYIAKSVEEPATYLEFGVFTGTTMRYWTKLLKHPDSALHGFDSFEGLPERWGFFVDKRFFDTVGSIPKFDDPRVRLFKGWFSETLPAYLREFKPHSSLLVHLDADLYSSTAFVLGELRPFIKPGVTLIFDEFFDRDHELKAFTELLDEGGFTAQCIAGTRALTQAAFRITSSPPSPAEQYKAQ